MFEWYDPDLIVAAFRAVQARRANAFLLVVTRTAEEASRFFAAKFDAGSFAVISAEHNDVPALLNAADLGLLLLKEAPNIRTSSPVKFAEYVNCGLPVLISRNVGDYSDLVTNTGIGSVFDNATPDALAFLDADRDELAQIGRAHV